VPKSLILLVVGFYFGHGYRRISAYLDDIAIISMSVALLAGLAFLFRGAIRTRKAEGRPTSLRHRSQPD
jgi:hypothetical protein